MQWNPFIHAAFFAVRLYGRIAMAMAFRLTRPYAGGRIPGF